MLVQQLVARQLVSRGKRVHARKLGPGDGDHLAGRIELHGAAAQRDHAAVQCQVFVRQLADVAQHAGLGVVAVEHRVCEECAGAAQRLGDQGLDAFFERLEAGQGLSWGGGLAGEHLPQGLDVLARGGLVQRDGDALVTSLAQVDAGVQGAFDKRGRGLADGDPHGVKRGFFAQLVAQALQALREDGGVARHATRNALQALGAVVHGVHAGDHGGEHLRGADVARGFFAADVLLAGLQGQAVGGFAVHVHAHTHQAAR